jgi:hypothetical protein
MYSLKPDIDGSRYNAGVQAMPNTAGRPSGLGSLPKDVLMALKNGNSDEALKLIQAHRPKHNPWMLLPWIRMIKERSMDFIPSMYQLAPRQVKVESPESLEKQIQLLALQLMEVQKIEFQSPDISSRLWKMLFENKSLSDFNKISSRIVVDNKLVPMMNKVGTSLMVFKPMTDAMIKGSITLAKMTATLFPFVIYQTMNLMGMTFKMMSIAGQLIARVITPVQQVYQAVKDGVNSLIEKFVERSQEFEERAKLASDSVKAFINKMTSPVVQLAQLVNSQYDRFKAHMKEKADLAVSALERIYQDKVKETTQIIVNNLQAAHAAVVIPLFNPMINLFAAGGNMTKRVTLRGWNRGKKSAKKFGMVVGRATKHVTRMYNYTVGSMMHMGDILLDIFLRFVKILEGLLIKFLNGFTIFAKAAAQVGIIMGRGLWTGFKNIPYFLYHVIFGIPRAFFKLVRLSFQR